MTFRRLVRPVLSAVALAAPLALHAQTQTPPANEQVVDPKVDRREVKLPKFPSKDFEVGVFLGTYATQNFGASAVAGLKLGYHITEDFFVEAAFGATKVSDESFRQILPGGVFVNETEKLSYYNLSVGYNILPGEVFIGRDRAFNSALYVVLGAGNTSFAGDDYFTLTYGAGFRVLATDSIGLHFGVRDHMLDIDVTGEDKTTHNIEFDLSATWFF